MINKYLPKKYLFEILLFSFAIFFSFYLMFHTFSYRDGQMIIATKVWSDFASHIPLIRSFSFGNNIPPEYPIFAGHPIRYHFLFYFLVGLLEKSGLAIDFALNIPSAISFFLLIIAIYLLAGRLFKSKIVGLLSVVFFLFNGSFSFLEFFKSHNLSANIIKEIITNTEYPSFAPYGKGIVSAFWNLNIYTNQRHLSLAIALLLLIIYALVHFEKKRRTIPFFLSFIIGISVGILLLFHSSIFIASFVILLLLSILLPKQRFMILYSLFLTGILAIPRLFFLNGTATFGPRLNFNYLITDVLTLQSFLKYWFMNLGLFIFLAPIGFFLSSTLAKKIFIAFLSIFIIGHTIQFSPEIAGNHKFFNLFVIAGNMFASFAIFGLWKKHILSKIAVIFIIFFMTLSGIIDFFPLKNDRFMTIDDYPKNPDVAWIKNNTPPESVFLNSTYLYHPASLAGRKIFFGWPYFTWSLGYETGKHIEIMNHIFAGDNIFSVCNLLLENKIDFVDINTSADKAFMTNYQFFETNSNPVYKNSNESFIIYDVNRLCSTL